MLTLELRQIMNDSTKSHVKLVGLQKNLGKKKLTTYTKRSVFFSISCIPIGTQSNIVFSIKIGFL